MTCPYCGSDFVEMISLGKYRCKACGRYFQEPV